MKYLEGAKSQIGNTDGRLTEFWFGLQAIGTSTLSLMFSLDHIGVDTAIFLTLNALFAIPQIILAWHDNLKWRHWSNWITGTLSFAVSISLIGNTREIVAVFGYCFLGLATFHCAFLTNRLLHKKKHEHTNNQTPDE